MSAEPSKVILAKIKKMVAANDVAGLRALHGQLRGSVETARVRFNHTRRVKDGETYRRRHAEMGLVRTQIALLEKPQVKEDVDSSLPSAFVAKAESLFQAKDVKGLYGMLYASVSARESAHRRVKVFNSDQSKEDLRRSSAEVKFLQSKIETLRQPEPINEDPTGALKDFATNAVQTARDRVLHHVGNSGEALGRLNGGALISQMTRDWKIYVGQQARTGNKIGKQPTHEDILEFLAYQYGIELDDHYLTKVLAGKPPRTAPPNAKVPEPVEPAKTGQEAQQGAKPAVPATPAAPTKEGLEATSQAEYDALRKKFTKGEVVTEALTDPVDMRAAIPKIVNFLWHRGLLKVQRGNKTYGSQGYWNGENEPEGGKPNGETSATAGKEIQPKTPQPKADTATAAPEAPENANAAAQQAQFPAASEKGDDEVETVHTDHGDVLQTASTRVTPDGHAIDIDAMKQILEQDNITGADVRRLQIAIQKADSKSFIALRRSPENIRTMASIVHALLKSITSKNDTKNVEAQHSVTKDGNLFDINKFTKELAQDNVTGEDLNNVRAALKHKGEQGLINAMSQDSRVSKVIFAIANAAINSITSNKNVAEPENEEPAPEDNDSLGPHRKIGQS